MVRISLQQSYHYKSFWSRIYVKDGLLKLRACQKIFMNDLEKNNELPKKTLDTSWF